MSRLAPLVAALSLALGALLPGPAPGAAPAEPAGQARRTLGVAAAANVKTAAEALERAFEAEQPGVDVVLSLGASGALFAQVRNGAPFDVFLSADREYPARLVAEGLATDERVYAIGKLVAWLPPGSTLDLERRGLAALLAPGVKRIALANPTVAPYGRAAEAALRSAGLLDALKDKLVLGTSVAQAAQFATSGAADVAFLPSSLASAKELQAGRAVPVPEALYPRLEQSGVVIAASRQADLGRAFLAFLAGSKARAILSANGYGLP